MFDLTLAGLLTRLVALLPIIAVHGFFLCLAARLLGDDGPSHDGRLTLNPLVHLDMLGALAFLAFGVGWITPLKLTSSALKGGVFGVLGVILAGFASLIVLAVIAAWMLPLATGLESLSGGQVLAMVLTALCRLGIGFALFNLIPVPPLSGRYLLTAVVPQAGAWIERRGLIAGIVLLAILASGVPGRVIDPGVEAMVKFISQDTALLSRRV